MKVLLAGASGLIGTALTRSLIGEGHVVRRLVRRAPRQASELTWSPERAELDPAAFDAIDAVVCLSGAGVGDHRWTDEYKAVLRASRLETVGTLARALAEHRGPQILLTASAVGYYGDTGDRTVDESDPAGQGFLATLCRDWEAAAAPAAAEGLRVAHLRSALVLSPSGGLLGRLRPIIRAGLGGRLGSGRQFQPWITLDDEVAAIRFVLANEVGGPVNLAAPNPVRNSELIATLARLLHRPAILPVPAFALRVALGEMAQDALTGQRAIPAKLTAAGFRFAHETVEAGLRAALGI